MDENPIVLLENLSLAHDQNPILTGINLSLQQGEYVFLAGRVGSGKSTLLKSLYAELIPMEGNSSVCGYSIRDIKKKEIPFLRRKMGIVFQDFQLLPDRNVYENLKFVLKATDWESDECDARIQEVLYAVGMIDAIKKLPSQLSGGEQQKVSIARALLNDPQLILADEPTGNLDPKSSAEIFELLMALPQQGKSLIMASHNYQLLQKYPDAKVLYCENGCVNDKKVKDLLNINEE